MYVYMDVMYILYYMSISPSSLDPDLKDGLVEVIEKLLKDQTTVSRVQYDYSLATLFNASSYV